MHFKMIAVIVDDQQTEQVLEVTRKTGATGATIINNVRGEGLNPKQSFFGMSIDSQRDLILFIVEEHLCAGILDAVESVIVSNQGSKGIAIKIDIEDIIGANQQIDTLQKRIKGEI